MKHSLFQSVWDCFYALVQHLCWIQVIWMEETYMNYIVQLHDETGWHICYI